MERIDHKARPQPHNLYSAVWSANVLYEAAKSVLSNNGAPGPDGITCKQFKRESHDRLTRLQTELKDLTYTPGPLRCIRIDEGGNIRTTKVANVVDRIVQTAVKLVIEPLFEPDFLACCFAYRSNTGTHDGADQFVAPLVNKKQFVVNADIVAHFDTLPHDRILEALKCRITDPTLLRLIHGFLCQKVDRGSSEPNGCKSSIVGRPQGSSLTYLLARICLHDLHVDDSKISRMQNAFFQLPTNVTARAV